MYRISTFLWYAGCMDKDTPKARLTLDLPPDLHRDIKVAAAMQGVTMRDLAEACLRRCLAEQQKQSRQ
jgi:predicted HicB family RNase H-like nuclease